MKRNSSYYSGNSIVESSFAFLDTIIGTVKDLSQI